MVALVVAPLPGCISTFVLSFLECVLLSAAWCMLVPPPPLSQLPHSPAMSPPSCIFQDRILLLCPGRILLLGQGAAICLLWEPLAIRPLFFLSKDSGPEYHCHAVLSPVLWASFQTVSS